MPECIEKKKLLKAIEESEPDVMADYGEYYGSEWGISRGKLYEIIANLPTLTPPNEWISVEDRLPEPGERVLATDCGFVGEFYINKRGKWQRYNVNCSELLMALDILYWMPLPKSPKEDE